jgi:predicted amidophosphoribosyltransferase
MFLVDVLCGLLRPAVCLACGAPAAWPCCARCLPPEPDAVGPWPLAADPDVALWALGPYRDALRAALLAGKLDGQPAALTELGRRLGVALATAGVGADLVTYVAAGRVAGRPRDHAERVAAGVAAALNLPLVGLLAPAGGHDLGRARRAGRSDRPPPSRPPPPARYRLAGGRVLLVDDLATTGGTLAGAAAALRHTGARQVEAAVLAAAPTALAPGPAPHPIRRAEPILQAAGWIGSIPAAARQAGSLPESHPVPPAPQQPRAPPAAPSSEQRASVTAPRCGPPRLGPSSGPAPWPPWPPWRLVPTAWRPSAGPRPPGPRGGRFQAPARDPRRLGAACPGCREAGL